MKRILFAAVAMMLFVSNADAVVYCAAGVYRAGCVVRPGYHPLRPTAQRRVSVAWGRLAASLDGVACGDVGLRRGDTAS
jgi:hypothetical protein